MNQIEQIWRSKAFQISVDISRILLVIIVALLLYKLYIDIEAVKLLHYNSCLICENKTGAICRIERTYNNSKIQTYNINLTLSYELLNKSGNT